MTEQNIPELRFLEFKEEWLGYRLGDNATIKGRLGWKGLKQSEYVENGYAYLIANKHINNGYINWKSADQINQFRYEESPEIALEKDDIIFSKDGALGNPALVKELPKPSTINSTMMLVRLNSKTISPDFFYQILLGPSFNKLIYLKVSGSSIPHLFQSDMKEFRFHAPTINEQKKIGDFFSKLDRQIELEEEKLELLEQQKKGYMQKLFSQELRFKTKDDVYYSEWQIHKLGEIFKYSQGQQISVDKQFNVKNNEMKRFIRIVDITENPEPRFVLYESDTGLVNKGDLFMIRYGRPGIVSRGFEGIIANNLFKLIPKIKISTIYFYYLLSYNYYRINLLTNQSTMPALNFKSLDLLKFKLPSYEEQNKIGNFFNKCDELIEKQNQKIDGLKERKKGFLQKMFV